MNLRQTRKDTGLLKQESDKPLYPDMVWSRPENKRFAGKLLIIGGQAGSLGAPAKAFTAAISAGVGAARVVLPDSTQKLLGKSFAEAEFAASNRSGSFGQAALGQILDASEWADAVLLAGDFGKNSETTILLEKFTTKFGGVLVIAGDSVEPFLQKDSPVNNRADTLLALEFSKLQKFARLNFPLPPLLNTSDTSKVSQIIDAWTKDSGVGLLTEKDRHVILSIGGQSSATEITPNTKIDDLSSHAAVWWLQQPKKPFEAITTGLYLALNPKNNEIL